MGKLILGTIPKKEGRREIQLSNGKIVTLDMYGDAPILNLLVAECSVVENVDFGQMYHVLVAKDNYLKEEVFNEEDAKTVMKSNLNNLVNKNLSTLNKDLLTATDEEIEMVLDKIGKSMNNNIRYFIYCLLKNFLILNCLKYYKKIKKEEVL